MSAIMDPSKLNIKDRMEEFGCRKRRNYTPSVAID